MHESKVFVTMILILIFAEVLGLYGCVFALDVKSEIKLTTCERSKQVDHRIDSSDQKEQIYIGR